MTRPTLAVVDDTEMIRVMVADILGSVVDVQSYPDVETVKALTPSADVWLVDYRLPGEDGVELARWLLDRNPSARIVIWTAFPERSIHAPEGVPVIQKGVGITRDSLLRMLGLSDG